MVGWWLRRYNYGFIYAVILFLLATGAIDATFGTADRSSVVWLTGATLLGGVAFVGAHPARDADWPRPFAPQYGGLAHVTMGMAATLLALNAFTSLAPGVSATPYAEFSVLILAQVCFCLLALLFYRYAILSLAFGLQWILGKFRFSAPLARRCTPAAVAFVLWFGVVASLLALSLIDTTLLIFPTIFAPALLGVSYLKTFSLRSVVAHLSLLGLAALYFKVYTFGLSEQNTLAGYLGDLSPVQIFGDPISDGLAILAVVGVVATAIQQLRRSLVLEPTDGTKPASLSIYPEARNYVSDDKYLDRLCRLLLESDGGVFGVTGLRGAGKTALLGAVMDRFRQERCVVWTVAPVSYQSDDKLSFLMSISRALCQKAINDADGVLYGHRPDTLRALEEFIRSIRIPVALGCLALAVAYLLGAQIPGSTPLLGPPLRMADTIQLPRGRIALDEGTTRNGREPLEASFEEARAAEVDRLLALLSQIDTALSREPQAEGEATAAESVVATDISHAVTPLPEAPGFDLVAGRPADFDPSLMTDRADSLRLDTQVSGIPTNFGDSGLFFSRIDPDVTHFNLYGMAHESQAAFTFLQEEFEHRIVRSNYFLTYFDRKNLTSVFELRVGALAVLRGDPRLAPHLEGISADLRNILRIDPKGATSRGLIRPDWASLILMAAFYDAAAILEDPQASEARKQNALDDLFLDAGRLAQLRAVLTRYVGILQGATLRSTTSEGGLGVGAESSPFSVQNFTARASSISMGRGIGTPLLLAVLLLVCFFPEVWRAANFVVRGLLNFRLLVLKRACVEFMELLNYSEGREATAAFSLRGLSLGGKRTLSARNLSLQSLTDRYQAFVSLLLTFYNKKLIVVIDELDKMSNPQDVKAVLLELKGALFQRGCYYLISISEDAAMAFRGRMSERRDIFESTFEDVLTIERMSPGAARAMVHRRLAADGRGATPVEDPAIDVLTVFSAAIPREIVRHLRETVLAAEGAAVEPRLVALDIFRSDLREWVESLKGAPLPGNRLISLIEIADEIEAMLPAREGNAPWPERSSGSASVGVKLAECLTILDPAKAFMEEEYDLGVPAENPEDIAKRRRLAEIQSCLRLMTMNELMRYIWQGRALDTAQSEAAVTCLRSIMIQPAVAARLLARLSVLVLHLEFPEQEVRAGAHQRRSGRRRPPSRGPLKQISSDLL